MVGTHVNSASQEWSGTGANVMHWGMYLQQQAFFLASLLAAELATVLGPVMYMAQKPIWEDILQGMTASPFTKGRRDLRLTLDILMGFVMAQPCNGEHLLSSPLCFEIRTGRSSLGRVADSVIACNA